MSKLHYGVSNISNTHCPLNNGVFFGGQNKWYKVLFFLDGLKCWRLTYVSSATKIMLLLAIWKDRNVDEWNQVWRKEEIKNVWHPNLRWKIQPLGSWQTLSIVRQEQHGRNRLRFKLWVMAFNLLRALLILKLQVATGEIAWRGCSRGHFGGPRGQVKADDRYRRTPQDLQRDTNRQVKL